MGDQHPIRRFLGFDFSFDGFNFDIVELWENARAFC